ncbi:hypothetical protein GcM1_226092 [Golovinomyces cichoracearum]|uniref:Uncharacterized protein n=1 Tax=Golovinomyces cichoracearum TaxID=62708 RepID=A0A420IQ34_9PEZI|nr:hypothetical protein GcM1_226092 [Golovinomyces cichoracearum]
MAETDKLRGTSISPRHIDSLDPETWGQPVDKTSSSVALTTYAVKLLADWEEYKEHGEDLFLLFKEEFANWSPDMFGKIKSPFKKIFRDYFHNNGVYTGKKTTAIGPAMITLLNAGALPEWPRETEQSMQDQQCQSRQFNCPQQQIVRQSKEGQFLRTNIQTYNPQSPDPIRPIRFQSPYP